MNNCDKMNKGMLYNHGATLFWVCWGKGKCCCKGCPNPKSNIIILLSTNMKHYQITEYWSDTKYHGEMIVNIYIGYLIRLRLGCMR